MKQSLPGIKRIAFVDCSLLPANITYRAMAGVPVGIFTSLNDICKVGEATCETEEQFDNNSQVEKASLTFNTLDELPTYRHLAFVIFTAQGDTFVIGTKELPYPTVKISRSTGTPDGEPSVRKYEVSFTAKKSLVLCAV